MSRPDLTATPEYQAYLRAREAVLRMKAVSPSDGFADPSAYWSEELDNIDYLVDASPLIVRKLRHHAFHITRIRPYDYRSKEDGRRESFEARLAALRALGGDALLVPEAPALGGFGYEIDGRLFNVDTLKFYEVLIGMERAGVLGAIRGLERPVVCEIGAGWAGFAYQFKTLFPRATYVIVDLPELFLFSGTYLASLFPGARLLFADTEAALAGWRDADFVFVPNTLADLVSTIPLDLTVNMVSFQEMTDAQVRGYARMAARAGCPLLYSLNRERSPYNTELLSVSDALADCYRLTEVPVLDTDYTAAIKKPSKRPRMVERSELQYRHYAGRLDPAFGVRRAEAPPVSHVAARPAADGPRVVLGMTLYNNARHLPEAIDSLLAQTWGDFRLVLLDDASKDDTERIARDYVARDSRVSYFRHAERKAMIATWRDVVDLAARECPSAEYFAWVSDHDLWHPRWLERMVQELDAAPDASLAYPITQRISQEGAQLEKGPRLFHTGSLGEPRARWNCFCDEGVGSGDMVYGLMRLDALRKAGTFRTVLRPDRLLIAELTLYGGIRQVPEVLWFRRMSSVTSIQRQDQTLVLPGDAPRWFNWAPSLQHVTTLHAEYDDARLAALGLRKDQWRRMLLRYQLSYGWRHFRKSDTSHAVNRTINKLVWARKLTNHHVRHFIYDTLVEFRAFRGRTRRRVRHGVYHVLMARHRLANDGAARLRAGWAAVRRAGRHSVYHFLMLTHRTGLRGGARRDE